MLTKLQPLPSWLRWLLGEPTRAQLIVGCNGVCFVAHSLWTVAVLLQVDEKMEVPVWRLAVKWNSSGADGYTATLRDNQRPLRIDLLTAAFFGISAFFHAAAALCGFQGPMATRYYWAQLEACNLWWRWLEYAFSAPTMALGICAITGLREQNALASVFMLMALTMAFGYLTELFSRPSTKQDGTLDLERWAGDEWRTNDSPACFRMRRRRNYIRRMLPHVLGIFPYVAAWTIVLNNFFAQLEDLRVDDKALFDRVPAFVPWAVGGSVLIFTSFTFPMWKYQWVAPSHYWKTELIYCALSLTAKSFLGFFLFVNVLLAASFDEALQSGSVD